MIAPRAPCASLHLLQPHTDEDGVEENVSHCGVFLRSIGRRRTTTSCDCASKTTSGDSGGARGQFRCACSSIRSHRDRTECSVGRGCAWTLTICGLRPAFRQGDPARGLPAPCFRQPSATIHVTGPSARCSSCGRVLSGPGWPGVPGSCGACRRGREARTRAGTDCAAPRRLGGTLRPDRRLP
jgi:hypothetical protein